MPASRSWLTRFVPAFFAASLSVAAAWPTIQAHRARRAAEDRVGAIAGLTDSGGGCEAFDPALSLRVQRLGPMLASWETVGGCGAGGGASVGTGVKWIGHSTTGGLFQVVQQGNYVRFTGRSFSGSDSPGYQYISATQISKDLSGKWTLGVSIPVLYKYYYGELATPELAVNLSNGGLGDISALLTRRLGRDNSTSLTGIVGFPTGTYRAQYGIRTLAPDWQLGFGRVTGTLMLDRTLDQDWGLIVLGAAAGYRGGRNDAGNYRAPGGSVYGYTGFFLGPFVPALGMTFTGFTQQDMQGDFGSTINAPVATVAGNASIEWSNDYVAVLLGTQVPYAVRGPNWGEGPSRVGFAWQPWTVSLGISMSPF